MELIRSGHRLGPCDDTGGADKDAAPLLNFHPWGNKMGETRQVLVPDIGDFKDVPIIEIQVQPGDRITAEAPLITLESDKASMEVPSPTAGVVKNIAVKLGDRVSQGAPILTLELDGAGCRRGSGETSRQRAAGADQRTGGGRRGAGTGHRRLQGRADHRGHGQGRRHG